MHAGNMASASAILDGTALVVDEALCINLRGRQEMCDRCQSVCPSQAISVGVDAIPLDRDACTGCGRCVAECPAGALSLSGFVPNRFLDSIDAVDAVDLHCRESRDGGGGVVIPCFQTLDVRLLAAACARGTRRFDLHGLRRCASCERGDAGAHLDAVERRLADWFGESAPRLERNPGRAAGARRHEHQPKLSRRGLLQLGGAKGVSQAARWLVPVEEPEDRLDALPFYQNRGESTQRPAVYQQLLVAAAGALEWRKGVAYPWRGRAVTRNCTGCLVCGERCPTGALTARVSMAERVLWFDARCCTDCGLCERICPVDAIVTLPGGPPATLTGGPQRLLTQSTQPCGHCGEPFVTESRSQTRCRVCRNEHELDDEWITMLRG